MEELWQLPRGEFDQLLATHLALSREAASGIERIRELLPLLPSSVYRREEEVQGFVSGPVDWPRTQQRRVATADPTLFVCRPATRRYDTPPARLVHWVLTEVGGLASGSGLRDEGETGTAVHLVSDQARRLLLHPKLTGIRRPRLATEEKLKALEARKPEFRPVTSLARLIRDGWYARDPFLVASVVEQRLLAPAKDDVLFELQVGFSLVDAFLDRGFEREAAPRLLQPRRGALPFARLHSSLYGALDVWWQRAIWSLEGMPPSRGKLRRILTDATMTQTSFRPDFILHLRDHDRPVIVEAKLTSKPEDTNEREGILESLAYLNDAETIVQELPLPRALVVAWNATGTPARSLVCVGDQDSVPAMVDVVLEPRRLSE